ncbi:hypothetical protein OZX57_04440 [Bifidobacterium sp. ESL0682]|uniref:hypothetical protein n=1 Tax=Bifidobacterium sp. ESL0682 TaxID=2983212 RepID=UPI0023F95D68|nr:hypothetical protein [Bifidobacterium sp. ESL0682]WEV42653.1 hypothetical protein OZX57_04440 [Bifidobacterium sp. ESL0682]
MRRFSHARSCFCRRHSGDGIFICKSKEKKNTIILNKACPHHKLGVYYARHSVERVRHDLRRMLVALVTVMSIDTAQVPRDFVIVGVA